MNTTSQSALILFGSETGNAQDVAEEVGRLMERHRFITTILDLDSIQLRDMVKANLVVFVVSTTGQGEMPQNARKFWKTLLSSALKSGSLRRVRFTSFGLGDSSYARYNVAHRMLCNRMADLGAQLICGRGEGNEQHPEGYSAGFREWIVFLREVLMKNFPLPDGLAPFAEDEFLEPKFRLEQSQSRIRHKEQRDDIDIPDSTLLPVRNAITADIISNNRITPVTHFQDVRLLEFHLEEPYIYGPGAIAVMYPKNFPVDVQDFINLMAWQDMADQPIQIKSRPDVGSWTADQQSPLRHLDLQSTSLTLRWLLTNVLDVMSIPRRSFFSNLLHFARDGTEDEKYQRDRLLELANPELIDELWDYTTRPKRTIVEVMSDFTTVQIPWAYALSVLPIIRGRQFSIASGGTAMKTEGGRTRVQLLVAIADPPSPIIKYRRRYGVCTRYIKTLKVGEQLSIGMQQGYLDVQSDEIKAPTLMIGPGTGLAPMRSMIHQRLMWAHETRTRPEEAALAGDILIFGCRNESADFFFFDEWKRLTQQSGLTVHTAFSRDTDKPREYVQDKIRANAVAINDMLMNRSGRIYVCGSSGNMPKGVREALLDIVTEQGELTKERAQEKLDMLEKQGRYKQETW